MSPAARHPHLTARSMTEAAARVRQPAARAPHAALRRAVRTLARAHRPRPSAFDGVEHWPRDAAPSGPAELRERLARTGEQQAWHAQDAAQEVAQRALARELAVYTRALRADGIGLRRTLAAVSALVREGAAPSLGGDPLAAFVHDAGRDCVTAYLAR